MDIERFSEILEEELEEAIGRGYGGGLAKEVVRDLIKKQLDDAIDISDIEDELKKQLSGVDLQKALTMAEHIKMSLKNAITKV